ncbi:hypothetical protein [Streptomyces clavuligerus]|uniref:hypothetical protein n=1 Tax=Streptomyces clavuligerus TaxID=1901 RepID=UPI0012FF54B9|nr:hypothetical protein [Streptomyces clavuligerus]WDN55907.1 hypothetical protein LL058_28840 [Streptomyces clavuligerus]
MSLPLARCVEMVARLLEGCGPLAPVRLCMSGPDVQAEVCAGEPAASLSMARLAAATGGRPAGPDGGHTDGVLTADLEGGVTLVAAVDPLSPGTTAGPRTTSTAGAAALLRTLAPWAEALDQELLPGPQLWVEDHGREFTVQLLATTASEDEMVRVAAAAGTGLERVRTWRTDSGLDGRGSLPDGLTVHLGVVCLP